MARPINFAGETAVENFKDGGPATALPVQQFEYQTLSCWRLSPEEIARVQQTGVIWLTTQLKGPDKDQPAVYVGADEQEARRVAAMKPGP